MPPRLSTPTAASGRANSARWNAGTSGAPWPPAATSRLRKSATTSMPVSSASSAGVVELDACSRCRRTRPAGGAPSGRARRSRARRSAQRRRRAATRARPRHSARASALAASAARCSLVRRPACSAPAARRAARRRTAGARARRTPQRSAAVGPEVDQHRRRRRRARCPTSGRCSSAAMRGRLVRAADANSRQRRRCVDCAASIAAGERGELRACAARVELPSGSPLGRLAIASGSWCSPLTLNSKCRCGPVAQPVAPTAPMRCALLDALALAARRCGSGARRPSRARCCARSGPRCRSRSASRRTRPRRRRRLRTGVPLGAP